MGGDGRDVGHHVCDEQFCGGFFRVGVVEGTDARNSERPRDCFVGFSFGADAEIQVSGTVKPAAKRGWRAVVKHAARPIR